jgi:hypothetical protein
LGGGRTGPACMGNPLAVTAEGDGRAPVAEDVAGFAANRDVVVVSAFKQEAIGGGGCRLCTHEIKACVNASISGK